MTTSTTIRLRLMMLYKRTISGGVRTELILKWRYGKANFLWSCYKLLQKTGYNSCADDVKENHEDKWWSENWMSLHVKMQKSFVSRGARVAQWWERSPPTNVARVQTPVSICGLSLLLVLSLAPRGFSPGTPVFPSPQKLTFPNSNSTRNQVDEEPLSGCATCKSLFILFIYL